MPLRRRGKVQLAQRLVREQRAGRSRSHKMDRRWFGDSISGRINSNRVGSTRTSKRLARLRDGLYRNGPNDRLGPSRSQPGQSNGSNHCFGGPLQERCLAGRSASVFIPVSSAVPLRVPIDLPPGGFDKVVIDASGKYPDVPPSLTFKVVDERPNPQSPYVTDYYSSIGKFYVSQIDGATLTSGALRTQCLACSPAPDNGPTPSPNCHEKGRTRLVASRA